jgi:hypothetical protein
MEGMIRHWQEQAQKLEERLRQLDLETGGREDRRACGGEKESTKGNAP